MMVRQYVIVNQRLAGTAKGTRVYISAVIEVKSKDHHLVLSRVNLKLKIGKDNYLPGSYDAGRLQEENLRETFHEQLNAKLESLKFDNVEDGWNNLEKLFVKLLMVF